MSAQFLRKRTEKHVYNWTAKLALRPDMVACDKDGKLLKSVPTLSIHTETPEGKTNTESLQTGLTIQKLRRMNKSDLMAVAEKLGLEPGAEEDTTKAALFKDISKALDGAEA
jgi:hypothetical protein